MPGTPPRLQGSCRRMWIGLPRSVCTPRSPRQVRPHRAPVCPERGCRRSSTHDVLCPRARSRRLPRRLHAVRAVQEQAAVRILGYYAWIGHRAQSSRPSTTALLAPPALAARPLPGLPHVKGEYLYCRMCSIPACHGPARAMGRLHRDRGAQTKQRALTFCRYQDHQCEEVEQKNGPEDWEVEEREERAAAGGGTGRAFINGRRWQRGHRRPQAMLRSQEPQQESPRRRPPKLELWELSDEGLELLRALGSCTTGEGPMTQERHTRAGLASEEVAETALWRTHAGLGRRPEPPRALAGTWA